MIISTSYSIFEKNVSRPEALYFIENRAFEGFWIWDVFERSIYVNHLLLRNLEYTASMGDEIFTLDRLLKLNDRKTLLEQISESPSNTLTFYYYKKNKEVVKYEAEFFAVKDYINRVTSYIFANIKMIEKKALPKQAKNFINTSFIHKEIFAELEQIAEIGGWEINLLTGQIIWTKQVFKIHEVPEDYIPKVEQALNFYVNEDREKVVKALRDTLKKSTPFDLNCRIITAKNNTKWVRCSGKIFLKNGKPLKIIGVFHDISAQIKQSEKLRISENTFRGNFEHSAIGMAILDEKGKWLEVNRRLCEILGYSDLELQQKTFQDITHSDDLDSDLLLLDELASGMRENYQIDKRYLHKNGSIIHVTLSASVVRNYDGTPFHYVSQILDITSNVNAKLDLQAAITKMEAVFNASTQVSIIATDKNGLIKNFNSGAENLLGYKAVEMIDIHSADYLHSPKELQNRKVILNLTESDADFSVFSKSIENGFDTREWIYTHKEGYQFPVLMTVTEISENNNLVGYLGVAIDLSEIKKVEKEITSLIEITKDQNERLKNFAHIVSHNLRSHVSNFKMLLDLLVHDHPEFKENEFIKYLETASEDLKETITHLNEVVQLNTTLIDNLEQINLHDVIEMNIRNVQLFAVEKNVTIHNLVAKEVTVKGISAYISSTIINFITNAIKYSNPEADSFIKLSTLMTDDYVELLIEDNGIGIDLQKNGHKLFGMYKTFHNNSDARGIGLFITKNQVEAMGGKIEVESILHEGTTFKIKLKK